MLKPGIDPEKLYRATFIRQYGLCCCNMALVSFRLFCKSLGHLREFFGQMVYPNPPPLAKYFPYAYEWLGSITLFSVFESIYYIFLMERLPEDVIHFIPGAVRVS